MKIVRHDKNRVIAIHSFSDFVIQANVSGNERQKTCQRTERKRRKETIKNKTKQKRRHLLQKRGLIGRDCVVLADPLRRCSKEEGVATVHCARLPLVEAGWALNQRQPIVAERHRLLGTLRVTLLKKRKGERQNLERENGINAMAVDGDDETSEGAPALAHNKKRHFRSLSNWW